MSAHIYELNRTGHEPLEIAGLLGDCLKRGEFIHDGHRFALMALGASNTARVLAARAAHCGPLLGVMSFRATPEGTKRITTGVLYREAGVGSALVRTLCGLFPDKPMWTKSRPAAWGWCDRLGMRWTGEMDGEQRIYRWTVEEVRAFAGERI